jgi:hypothetical protein
MNERKEKEPPEVFIRIDRKQFKGYGTFMVVTASVEGAGEPEIWLIPTKDVRRKIGKG